MHARKTICGDEFTTQLYQYHCIKTKTNKNFQPDSNILATPNIGQNNCSILTPPEDRRIIEILMIKRFQLTFTAVAGILLGIKDPAFVTMSYVSFCIGSNPFSEIR